MASSSRIPPNVDSKSAELLERAYKLSTDADTHDLYRDWAETYDKTMLDGLGYLSPRLVSRLLADHVSNKTIPVLDVGAGTGLAGLELASLGFTAIDAIDYSADMLAVAAQRGIYGSLLEGDLTKPLDITDATYGAAVCTGTFTHGHVGPSCLAELFRTIRPGGLFAFSINTGVWVDAGFERELDRLETSRAVRLVTRQAGVNYETSSGEDSWLNLYERR
ncbi:class I SAM-dependent DNA methyltransferase [Anderseniella sp. Alg231-50]|uniref:class I SAM-dependent DNA methyltransferase n=1 Tax=Anderseniella sp. Alg231-50 TaxID=1922226 RepID=UPI00307B4A75